MNLKLCDLEVACRLCLACVCSAMFCGCNSSEQSSADSIWIDAGKAGVVAVERFDSNGDQVIDQAEWAKSPSLANTFADFDADGDGKVGASDVTGRLLRLSMSDKPLAEVECRVQQEGTPLPGASVRFKPMLVKPAPNWAGEGVTNAQGIATISLPADAVPAELQGAKGIPPGVYLVEITHPERQIPARYNSATELGAVVDPTSKAGLTAQFDVTTK